MTERLEKNRKRRHKRINLWLLSGVLCLAAFSGVVLGTDRQECLSTEETAALPSATLAPDWEAETEPPDASGESVLPQTVEAVETAAPQETEAPKETESVGEMKAPAETAPSEETAGPGDEDAMTDQEVTPLVLEGYDYSQPVPESDEAPADYFDDAAFVGDSRTDGLLLYSGIHGATGLSYKGLTVAELEDRTVKFTVSGITDTVMGALSKKSYGKVYIMLGVNELGWYNDQRFYDIYTKEVERIKELQPQAYIYVQSILPVTQEESDSHPYFTNENILRYNELIAQVAEEQQVFYLDVGSALMDDEGALPAESSTDGIHLKKDDYSVWFSYLKNHIVSDETA
jgi:lysophospholipase L1-like esterase